MDAVPTYLQIHTSMEARAEHNARKIEINSSDGWNRVLFEIERVPEGLRLNSFATGQFWNRSVDSKAAELVDDFEVRFHQTIVTLDALVTLRDELKGWLESQSGFSVQLAEAYPAMEIFVGDAGTAEGIGKSNFVFAYRDARVETRVEFTVDQSCLRLMLEDTETFLSQDQG